MNTQPEHIFRRDLGRALRYAAHNDKPEPGEFLDLNPIPREDLHKFEGACVVPPPSVDRYLASGDPLTHHSINQMELAIEQHYNLAKPFYITAQRGGEEKDGSLKVEYFILLVDPEEQED